MARYVSTGIELEHDEAIEIAYDMLRELVPGWEPSATLDSFIIQTTARIASELREFASDFPEEAFRYFGQNILGIHPKLPTYASMTVTVTAIDSQGYILPAGTVIGARRPDGEYEGFAVAQDYEIPNGSVSVSDVVAFAVNHGAQASGLSTSDLILQSGLIWVDSVVGAAPTSGGSDGETTDEYMDRLVDQIRIMAPRPIVPDDFSIMAQSVEGVGRAYVLNLYDADTGNDDVEKCVTVVIVDPEGEVVDSAVKTEVEELFARTREINFNIFVRDPQYQLIDVEYDVMAVEGWDETEIETAINLALDNYVGPSRWGEIWAGTEPLNVFRVDYILRYLEVATVINNVPGVDYIKTLKMAKADIARTAADVDMTPASGIPVILPRLDEVVATISFPS